jgi:hypothetical protein
MTIGSVHGQAGIHIFNLNVELVTFKWVSPGNVELYLGKSDTFIILFIALGNKTVNMGRDAAQNLQVGIFT